MMIITSVDVYMLKAAITETAVPAHPVVCRVNTDEGIYGYGEAGIFCGYGQHAVFGIVQDIAEQYLGTDPLDGEVTWERIRTQMNGKLSGGGGIIWSGFSALDIATMDIKGKVLGVPCYRLIGGKQNPKLSCYASHVQNGWNEIIRPLGAASEYADMAEMIQKLGYTAVKFDFLQFDRDGRPLSRQETANGLDKRFIRDLVEERFAAIRERCGSMMILMDNLCRLDVSGSWELGRLAEKYEVAFMEECLDPFFAENYLQVEKKVHVPLAGGEKVQTRWGFAKYFEKQIFRIIQPEITNCGGLNEAKKICDMAHAYDVKAQAHVCGTGIAQAAALHLETAIPNFTVHEDLWCNGHHDITDYCKYNYAVKDGWISAPEIPGLGNELTDKAIREAELHVLVR